MLEHAATQTNSPSQPETTRLIQPNVTEATRAVTPTKAVAITAETSYKTRMPRLSPFFSLLALSCAQQHATRLPDGSYAIECTSQKVCLDRAARQCGSAGYDIISGQHAQEVAGVPGNEKVVGKDDLRIRCKEDPTQGARTEPTAPPTTGLGEPVICRPGETQECVGPGACQGGQSCILDGTGYGPCDCGGSTSRTD